VSDEDLTGASSSDGEERKGAPPRKKLTKISNRDLSELKSGNEVTRILFLMVKISVSDLDP